MGDVLAALVAFASKVKDDPNVSALLREAASELHEVVSKLVAGQASEGSQPQEAPPAEPAPPQPEG